MLTNLGNTDRVIRALLGIALIALAFAGPRTLWGLVGVIPLATALVSFCPIYRLLGIRTCAAPAKNVHRRQ